MSGVALSGRYILLTSRLQRRPPASLDINRTSTKFVDRQYHGTVCQYDEKFDKSHEQNIRPRHWKSNGSQKVPDSKASSFSQSESNVLYGMRGSSSEDRDVYMMPLALAPKIKNSTLQLKSQDVAQALYGMHDMSNGHREVREVPSALLSQVRQCKGRFTARNISMCLYNLRELSGDDPEVRALLSALVLKVQSESFSPAELGDSLLGLRGISNYCSELLPLLSSLAPKILGCKERFSAKVVSDCLHGLKEMSSNCPEVCYLLSALLPKVKGCTDPFSAQEVCNAIRGLQNMSSKNSEVRAILGALHRIVRDCESLFSSQDIAGILFCFPGMSSDCAEVRALLAALALQIVKVEGFMGVRDASLALNGLQAMTADSAEVQGLLANLLPKVTGGTATMSAHEVSSAVYGLQGMAGEEVSSLLLLRYLHEQLQGIADRTSHFKTLPTEVLVPAARRIAAALESLVKGPEGEEWRRSCSMLTDEAARRLLARDAFFQGGRGPKQIIEQERRMHSIAKGLFQHTSIVVTVNDYLLGLFESDLVLHVPLTSDSGKQTLRINVEIDGLLHNRERKKRFCILRDRYLVTQGIVVARIRSASLRNMTDQDIEEWLLESVADVLL